MTRYDLMKNSPTQFDPKDRQPWPDPLSVKYASFYYNEPPTQFAVDDTFIERPFLTCYAIYNEATYDDLILMINNIPHISLVEQDYTVVKFPVKADIIKFAKKKV